MEKTAQMDLSRPERFKVAVLGSLYSAYKKLHRIDAPLPESAEFYHPPTRDYNWNESYYFNFIHPQGKIGGFTRIGILPNQESDIGVMMLYAGETRLLATYQGGRVEVNDEGLKIGPLEYRRQVPLQRWRLLFKGEMVDIADSRMLKRLNSSDLNFQPVDVDITFEGTAPCFNFKNSNSRALAEMIVTAGTRFKDLRKVSKISSEHYEQVGKYTGALKIGEEETAFNGSGHRDHSWGARDWSAPRLWTWLTCQFSDELAFNLSRVAIDSVDVYNGFVCRGGRNYPLRRAELHTEFEEDGLTQKKIRFRMEDTGGEVIEVTGDVLTVIPLDLTGRGHSTLINEALTEYRWETRVGYGIAEYLHQIR